MKTIQDLAKEYADSFERATREDGTRFLRLKVKNEDLTNLIHAAHNNMMPDDYRYQYIHEALEAIAEADDIDDICLEPDCYNMELLNWVSSNLTRADYVDEAIKETCAEYTGLFNALMLGQLKEKEEILYSVRQSLEELI